MALPEQFYDIDGEPVALHTLCRKEPEWAESQIRTLHAANAKLEAEVERLHALHLERTELTTRMIQERDAAEAKLAAIEGCCENHSCPFSWMVEMSTERTSCQWTQPACL